MSADARPETGNVSRKTVRTLDAATAAPFVIFLIVYALVPRFAADKGQTMLIYIGINTMLAISLNLLMGYAGQVSLGDAAFFGLGAYTSAILTVRPIPAEVTPGLGAGLSLAAGCVVFASLTCASGADGGGCYAPLPAPARTRTGARRGFALALIRGRSSRRDRRRGTREPGPARGSRGRDRPFCRFRSATPRRTRAACSARLL